MVPINPPWRSASPCCQAAWLAVTDASIPSSTHLLLKWPSNSPPWTTMRYLGQPYWRNQPSINFRATCRGFRFLRRTATCQHVPASTILRATQVFPFESFTYFKSATTVSLKPQRRNVAVARCGAPGICDAAQTGHCQRAPALPQSGAASLHLGFPYHVGVQKQRRCVATAYCSLWAERQELRAAASHSLAGARQNSQTREWQRPCRYLGS